MKRIPMTERPNWQDAADKEGFTIHHMYGEKYWDETNAYQLSLPEIENNIEDPTTELIGMCYEAVDFVVENPEYLTKLKIPAEYHEAIIHSWNEEHRDIYGRFDLSYDGVNPAKMLEFNADTPTSLYESSIFQWLWLQDKIKSGDLVDVDQFNSIHEQLVDAFKALYDPNKSVFHFAGCLESEEDKLTIGYIADCAFQAGFEVHIMDVEDIGISINGEYTDLDDNIIQNLFKLYPLEMMFESDYGHVLKNLKVNIYEPLWKSILSNKGILPILWQLFPEHPNLLPAFFLEEDMTFIDGYVKKPFFSREGQNVTIKADDLNISSDGEYGAEGYIIQKYHPLPKFGDDYAVIGSWVIAGNPAGIGIREDKSPITKNLSRFVPHFIKD
jgi:glutathionylspermidine synthase